MKQVVNRARYFGVYIATFVVGLIMLSILPVYLMMEMNFDLSKYLALSGPLYVIPMYFLLWLPQRRTHRKMENKHFRASTFKLSLPALTFSILHLMSAAFFFAIRCQDAVRLGTISEFPKLIVYVAFSYMFLVVGATMLYPFFRNVRSQQSL